MTIIAATILYNPSAEDCTRLTKIAQSIPTICWANSNVDSESLLSGNLRVINPGESVNHGLAFGINMISAFIKKTYQDNIIITLLDQDTLISSEQIFELANGLANQSSKYSCYVSPAILGSSNQPWISWFSITNGLTLYSYDLDKIAPLPRILMADGVDILICDRLKSIRISQYVLKELIIPHNVGAGIKEHILPDVLQSLKKRRYIRKKYFYHATLRRNLMKFHSYGYLALRANVPTVWIFRKICIMLLFMMTNPPLLTLRSFIRGVYAKPF